MVVTLNRMRPRRNLASFRFCQYISNFLQGWWSRSTRQAGALLRTWVAPFSQWCHEATKESNPWFVNMYSPSNRGRLSIGWLCGTSLTWFGEIFIPDVFGSEGHFHYHIHSNFNTSFARSLVSFKIRSGVPLLVIVGLNRFSHLQETTFSTWNFKTYSHSRDFCHDWNLDVNLHAWFPDVYAEVLTQVQYQSIQYLCHYTFTSLWFDFISLSKPCWLSYWWAWWLKQVGLLRLCG